MTDARMSTAAKDPATKDTNLHALSAQIISLKQVWCSPHDKRDLLVRELSDIHAGSRIRFVQSPREEMGQLVEFTELPLCKRSVTATAYTGRILMVLLLYKVK